MKLSTILLIIVWLINEQLSKKFELPFGNFYKSSIIEKYLQMI